MLFPFLTIFIVFLLYYAFRRHQITQRENKRASEFWSKENRALNTKRKDISNQLYYCSARHLPDWKVSGRYTASFGRDTDLSGG